MAAVGTGPVARWAERQPSIAGAPGRATVAARIPLGCPLTMGRSLRTGFGALWVACDGVLLRIDPAANRIAAVIPLEAGVADIAFSDNWVWVTSGSSAHRVVYQIDPATNQQVIATPVAGDPNQIVVAEGFAWVLLDSPQPDTPGPGRVARLDADTGARLGLVELPGAPVGIRRIDSASGRVLATIPVPAREIRAIALGQGAVWVATNAELYRLDPADARVVGAPAPLEAPSVAMAVGEGGVWVGQSGRETFITRFDPTP